MVGPALHCVCETVMPACIQLPDRFDEFMTRICSTDAAGVGSVPGVCGYAAAKHAVVGMMRTAAAEYGPKGLRINCINPGGTGELLEVFYGG